MNAYDREKRHFITVYKIQYIKHYETIKYNYKYSLKIRFLRIRLYTELVLFDSLFKNKSKANINEFAKNY